jgi:hypothetical protein
MRGHESSGEDTWVGPAPTLHRLATGPGISGPGTSAL